ncbi:MAG TPA: hypothetical protein PKE07_13510 [Lacibacter sp.]|nr:hypothetical protein [Lacibacter sp.]HMO88508.1 hypothetical protein [Lacibacter sp.]
MTFSRIITRLAGSALLVLAGILLLNLVLGLLFTLWNRNKNHLGGTYTDAPYVYYQKKEAGGTGFDIPATISLQKDSPEYRILLLGGSVAHALGNLTDSAGRNLLEGLLQTYLPGRQVVLLNGALPAFVSAQELIALQLHLRNYQPDLVVALHGFNDTESFRVNHPADDPHFIPSPLFYAGDEFSPALRAVEEYKKTYTLRGVWEGATRYIRKTLHFIGRAAGLSRYPYEQYETVTTQTLDRYGRAYVRVVKDLQQFCAANGMQYADFLQPVRFYRPGDSTYHRSGAADQGPELLARLYYRLEQGSAAMPGHQSLTGLDPAQLGFTDACHPDDRGYRWLATQLAAALKSQLQE